MAKKEVKPWSDLSEAVGDFWNAFFAAPDSKSLKLFCENKEDARFPERFLEDFVTKVSESGWTINGDPKYEIPKSLMNDAFEETKKKMEEQVVDKDEEETLLTQEQIQKKMKSLVKKSEGIKKALKEAKDEKTQARLNAVNAKKEEEKITNMKNQLKGCYNVNEEGAK